jgi:CBS domain-containing protein
MTDLKAKDLMLSLYECATVSESATLYDAVAAMEATRKMYQKWDYRPRMALVYGDKQRIVGIVRHYDILQSLEPNYGQMGGLQGRPASVSKMEFATSTYHQYRLWRKALSDLCLRASRLKVKDVMRVPEESESISSDAPIGEAIHRMLTCNHPSLLVTDAGDVLGILRMSDVAGYVIKEMKRHVEK